MISEWIKKHRINDWLSERLVCKDGFEMSVQASNVHYCSPRIDNADYYSEVEVGYPTVSEEELLYYAEDRTRPTETVYGYVPVELVDKIISKHGGVNDETNN